MTGQTKYFIGIIFPIIFFSCNSSRQESNPFEAFEQYLLAADNQVSLWVKNGEIVDGMGKARYQADLLIENGKIVFIGKVDSSRVQAEQVWDAKGKVVTPGFIDAHAHGSPFETPEFQNFLAMGVTSICLGQDGGSPSTKNINTWMTQVDSISPAVNIAMFVGHGTLRHLSGTKYKPEPSAEELGEMKKILQSSFDAGCYGMTTGLEYTPGIYAQEEEMLALAKVVGENNGLIMSHVRNEDDDQMEKSVKELLKQGQFCNVQVSHIKVVYGKSKQRAQEILDLLESARQKSKFNVTADFYPYNASYTGIGIVFPTWAKAPNDYKTVLRTRITELAKYLRTRVNYRNGPDATLLGTPPYSGKTLAQVSKEKGKPFEEVLMNDIGPTGASGAYFVMNDSLQSHLLTDSLIMVCSDGSPTMRHPRGYGTFAKIIETYVQERQLFSLEEAVRKMTGLTAKTIGLKDRGTLEVGKKADILVFSPEKFKAKATYPEPHQLAEGIDLVLVNGKISMENGKFETERWGRVLRRTNSL